MLYIFTSCHKIYIKYFARKQVSVTDTSVLMISPVFCCGFFPPICALKVVESTQIDPVESGKENESPLENNCSEAGSYRDFSGTRDNETAAHFPGFRKLCGWTKKPSQHFVTFHCTAPTSTCSCDHVCTSGLAHFLFLASYLDMSYCEYGLWKKCPCCHYIDKGY